MAGVAVMSLDAQKALEGQMLRALQHRNSKLALACLRCLPFALEEGRAGEYLELALDCEPEVLRTLLSRLPKREYACVYEMKTDKLLPQLDIPDLEVAFQGTLPLIAAARDLPEHLQILLDRGHDPNSAGIEASGALLRYSEHIVSYGYCSPFQPYVARPESSVSCTWADGAILSWSGITPLCAAVLSGSGRCVELLLRREDVWRMECPWVAAAVMMPRKEEDLSGWLAGEMVAHAPGRKNEPCPNLEEAAVLCTPQQLEQALTRICLPVEVAARAIAKVVREENKYQDWSDEGASAELLEKLEVFRRYVPGAFACEQVANALLYRCCRGIAAMSKWKKYLRLYRKPLDVSECVGDMLECHGRAQLRKFLTFLEQDHELVMDRDVVSRSTEKGKLGVLLNQVRLNPPATTQCVSGLSLAILDTGDVRFIQGCLERGLIPEPVPLLLQAQRELGLPNSCRMLLLSTGTQESRSRQIRIPQGHNRWYPRDFEKTPNLNATTQEQDRQLMIQRKDGRLQNQALSVCVGEYTWHVDDTLQAMALAGKAETVRWWVEQRPNSVRNIDSIHGEKLSAFFTATPLCAAALAGRSQVVRTLMDAGVWGKEENMGTPGTLTYGLEADREWQQIPVTPLMVALSMGHWDCAGLLLEAGCTCDMDWWPVRRLFEEMGAATLEDVKKNMSKYLQNGHFLCKAGHGH